MPPTCRVLLRAIPVFLCLSIFAAGISTAAFADSMALADSTAFADSTANADSTEDNLGYIASDGKLHLPDIPHADSLALDELYRGIDLIFPVAGADFHSLEYAEEYGESDFRCQLRPNHYGNDIFAPIGTAVLASADGVVILSAFIPKAGPGNMIAIDHGNGVYTYYLHLSTREVSVGDVVSAGDKIGEVGNTGNATGTPPHLHFEVELGVEVQDRPSWYLDYVNFKPGIDMLRSTDPTAYICVRENDGP